LNTPESRATCARGNVQQLHLVGFTTDLEGLIFSARKGSKSGSFLVRLDDGLLARIDEAERLRNGGEADGEAVEIDGRASASGRRPRPESELSPREIQARLRAGATIATVANAAGVDEEWVSRFAAPILAEQNQVVERARQLVYSKARLGPSAHPLGTSVVWNLADRGLRLTEDAYDGAWRAWNAHGAVWIVRFDYQSRQRAQAAEWEVDLREGTLHARNRVAADLGYIEPGRRRRAVPMLEPTEREAAPPPTPASGSTRRAPARKTTGATKVTKASKAAKARKATKATKASKPSSRRGATARSSAPASRAKKAAPKKAAAKKATATRRATAARSTRSTPARTAKKQAARKAGRPAPASGPPRPAAPEAPAFDERVSHLARPAAPPARRDAARVLSPGISPVVPTRAGGGGDGLGGTARRPAPAPSLQPEPAPASARPPAARAADAGATARSTRPVLPAPTFAAPTSDDHISPSVVIRRPREAQSAAAPIRRPQPDARPTPTAARVPASAPAPAPGSGPARAAAPAQVPARAAAPDERPRPAPVRSQPPTPARSEEPAPARPRPPAPAPTRAPAPGPVGAPVAAAPGAAAPASTPPPAPAPERPAPVRSVGRVVAQAGPPPASAANGRQRLPDRPEPADPNRGERNRGADDDVWGGPGSGEPAPAVRIRADLAAAANARQEGARRVRRSTGRERPLRAR
jgi:hypothetical protein